MSDLDIHKVFRVFGGPPGLHAKLAKCRYVDKTPTPVAVRVWKSRGNAPGQFVLPILLLLRDAGKDPFEFVTTPAEDDANPFEGLV